MPLSIEERNAALARGRATAKANREAAKQAALLQAQQTTFDDPLADAVEEPALQVEVNIPEQVPPQKLSLKDRLMGGKPPITSKPAVKARSGRTKKQENNLFSTVLPTIIASFVATYSQQMLQEPYKMCAPSREEVNGILAPLMAMIGRRVQIVGRASQDVIDITNATICSLAYGTRAYITYVQIKQYEEGLHATGTADTASQPGRTDSNTNTGATGYRTGQNVGGGQGPVGTLDRVSNDPVLSGSNGDSEAALIASMFERDKRGRVRLGLLAG
jgi:hypothetical protein